MTETTAQRSGRRTLILLAVFFSLPLLAAWGWYFFAAAWQPMGTTNHGQFVTPPRQIHSARLPLALGAGKLSADYLSGRWTLVYIGPPGCNADCKAALYSTRQVRLAVGKNIERVQRLYLVTGTPTKRRYLRRQHPDLTVVNAAGPKGQALIRQFTRAAPGKDRIYIVDPLGNLMMSYPQGADAGGLLADLRHLLRLSHVG
jgi:hypothetical protein